jgi:bacterioferritin-associated ferredoxin
LADVLLVLVGGSANQLGHRMEAQAWSDGRSFNMVRLDNDWRQFPALKVRQPDGSSQEIKLTQESERWLRLGQGNPRDKIRHHALLMERYQHLLRGIDVAKSYRLPGAGGHAFPVITALDIDLNVRPVLNLLRRGLSRLFEGAPPVPGKSHLWMALQRAKAQTRRMKRIVVIGGGCGSCGNAAHQLLPGLIRYLLEEEMNVSQYHLWGAILGPKAFSGRTPFVQHNYRALMEAVLHSSREGQKRRYLDGIQVNFQKPLYDRLFLFDDPQLPSQSNKVSEEEMNAFLDRSAQSLYLLMRPNIWDTLATPIGNPEGFIDSSKSLHTVRSVLAGLDRPRLTELLTAQIETQMLETLAKRLAT